MSDDTSTGEETAAQPETLSRTERLEQEGDIAADYLEELLDIADLDGDLDMDVEGDRAAVSIVGWTRSLMRLLTEAIESAQAPVAPIG